jgi:hypothetical protein
VEPYLHGPICFHGCMVTDVPLGLRNITLTARTLKSKGNGHPITDHEGPRGGVEILLYSFSTSALGGVVWSAPRSDRFTPGTRYPLYRRLGGPQGRSGRVRKIAPLPGFGSDSEKY